MYKLAIFFTLVIFVSAKTVYLENDFEDLAPIRKHNHEKIWVLKFNDDFEVNPLREPNKSELKIFKTSIAPVLKRNQKIRNKDNAVDFNRKLTLPDLTTESKNSSIEEIKSELKKIINKFIQSIAQVDAIQSISSKKNKNTSLKIFFKGTSCTIVLQSGRFRNVYFNDAENDLLPRWFFEEHVKIDHDSKGDFVPIPKEVKTEFYVYLLHLVKALYGHPI